MHAASVRTSARIVPSHAHLDLYGGCSKPFVQPLTRHFAVAPQYPSRSARLRACSRSWCQKLILERTVLLVPCFAASLASSSKLGSQRRLNCTCRRSDAELRMPEARSARILLIRGPRGGAPGRQPPENMSASEMFTGRLAGYVVRTVVRLTVYYECLVIPTKNSRG